MEDLRSSADNGCSGCKIIFQEIGRVNIDLGLWGCVRIWQPSTFYADPSSVESVHFVEVEYGINDTRRLLLAADDGSFNQA